MTGHAAYVDHIEGRLLIERDLAEGEALLRRAIAAAGVAPKDDMARQAHDQSYAVLTMDAGRRGDFGGALELLLRARGQAGLTACALGVAGEDRLLVVAADADGVVRGEYRTTPEGSRIVPVDDIVFASLRASLSRCPVIDVYANGAYYGLPRLLPRELAWR